jgi:hypothetical protein
VAIDREPDSTSPNAWNSAYMHSKFPFIIIKDRRSSARQFSYI